MGEHRDWVVGLLAPVEEPAPLRVASATRAVLDADHVGMLVTTEDILTPLDCIDDIGARLDEQQFSLGDGPTLLATRSTSPVVAAGLHLEAGRLRWPLFAALATRLGMASAVALPLCVGGERLGVLTAYRSHSSVPNDEQYADAIVLARLATGLLVADHAGVENVEGSRLSAVVVGGLRNQSIVHQAAGMVSEQLGVSIVEALVRLRAHAAAADLPLAVVGRSIVAGELALER